MLLFPKPTKQKKAKKRLKRAGSKGKVWIKTRNNLIERFAAAGITTCELRYSGCWFNNALSFAHSKKRRYIASQFDLEDVCLACTHCHSIAEYSPNMYETISNVIKSRKVTVTPRRSE